MSGFTVIIGLSFLLCLLLDGVNGQIEEKRKVYVVYMGAVPSQTSENTLKENHIQLLASVLPREKPIEKSLIRQYKHGFSGFAARLTKNEANAIKKKAGVISVFVEPIYELHTTRSWDFLEETSPDIESTESTVVSLESIQTRLTKNEANAVKKKAGVISAFVDPIYELYTTRSWDFLEETSVDTESTESTHAGSSPTSAAFSDTIIGLLDTGIWPESESFRDSGMGPIPSRWKGICMEGDYFNSSNCNRKLIGARYYDLHDDDDDDDGGESYTPRDNLGHGTHTASTAAGNPVMEASMYGLADGTAKGGSISSRIAMYKVCGLDGCPGSAVLSAFDDAIADGVDLLSISIGFQIFTPYFLTDPIAIGAFHAVDKGITVVCSAGNDGPQAGSVDNVAPWILTVGATTIDRHFESDVLLGGNNTVVKGTAINFSNLTKSASYPLIYGASAKSNSSDDAEASHCNLDSIDGTKIKGKIVLCKSSDTDISKFVRTYDLQTNGAVGAIVVDDMGQLDASSYKEFPVTEVTTEGSDEILKYINSTKNPMATILPTITVPKYKPAPEVAYFSSRGPSSQTSNIIKPDISAPGVNILASWTQNKDTNVIPPPGQKLSHFNIFSGTSMACPHVAGIAATIKSWNPTWSPAAIRSAIMTTAMQTNNDKVPVTTDSGSAATPYDYGAGVINPTRVLQPGLVYEIETNDYLQFLCNYGYTRDIIKNITVIPNGFECSKNSSKNLISNLNYPSIAISDFTAKERRLVSRVVKNVGGDEVTTYVVSIKSPPELNVEVSPDKLQFSKSVTKLSYQISFSASSSQLKGDYFGSITWSDGTHRVRSPFVVKSS